MPLKIIGSGLGRTGTFSLKLALEILGFGNCYHMTELFQYPSGLKYFKDAEKGKPVEWEELFKDYKSSVDYPGARFYKNLYSYYPEAKVIHTVRDPEEWYKSASATIFPAGNPFSPKIIKLAVHLPFSLQPWKRIPVMLYGRRQAFLEFGKDLKNKEKVISKFNEHTDEVMRTIPRDKLLVFDVRSGWTPLCEFLNLPVPGVPFPVTNSREEFFEKVRIIGSGKFLE
ncbi:MAG TPA: sulfotransferase [Ignavibacteria bacterium]|nr:sulfotransferase [Ignavibacteria bacterium]HMR39638.1 sulfotransferase [Ignavibacteria bacterium]